MLPLKVLVILSIRTIYCVYTYTVWRDSVFLMSKLFFFWKYGINVASKWFFLNKICAYFLNPRVVSFSHCPNSQIWIKANLLRAAHESIFWLIFNCGSEESAEIHGREHIFTINKWIILSFEVNLSLEYD